MAHQSMTAICKTLLKTKQKQKMYIYLNHIMNVICSVRLSSGRSFRGGGEANANANANAKASNRSNKNTQQPRGSR